MCMWSWRLAASQAQVCEGPQRLRLEVEVGVSDLPSWVVGEGQGVAGMQFPGWRGSEIEGLVEPLDEAPIASPASPTPPRPLNRGSDSLPLPDLDWLQALMRLPPVSTHCTTRPCLWRRRATGLRRYTNHSHPPQILAWCEDDLPSLLWLLALPHHQCKMAVVGWAAGCGG